MLEFKYLHTAVDKLISVVCVAASREDPAVGAEEQGRPGSPLLSQSGVRGRN